ncbi:MAG: hypothetical protein H6582_08260 [Crocinitomicaceae bacterium]|nr:hypothetical protein [Crocinitomicaceae bacterium]
MNLPNIGIVLDYENLYGIPEPKDRIDFLKRSGISKTEVLARLALINGLLMPRNSIYFDYSKKKQIEILNHLLRTESTGKTRLKNILKDKVLIFNRPSNVFGMMEIINSDLINETENGQTNELQEQKFIEYYLCLNKATSQYSHKNVKNPSLEELNAGILAYNELFQNTDPVMTIYKGILLFKHLVVESKYSKDFEEYLMREVGKDWKSYLTEIGSLFLFSGSTKEEFSQFIKQEGENPVIERLSKRELPIKIGNQLEALDIKKSPLYEFDKNSYVILDRRFVLDKCYNLIIWEFLFDSLLYGVKDPKQRKSIIKEYKGEIGKFYEGYIEDSLRRAFHFLKHPEPKLFDDLLEKGNEKGDIYIRHNKRILFGEVKSSNIPSASKYGKSLKDFYGDDRDKFFKDHGLTQLVKNLKSFLDDPHNLDAKFQLGKKHTIYPIIITRDISLTVVFTIHLFNKEFDSLFNRLHYSAHEIKPLMILHTSDLEQMEQNLADRKFKIFNILDKHFKKHEILPGIKYSLVKYKPKRPNILNERNMFEF